MPILNHGDFLVTIDFSLFCLFWPQVFAMYLGSLFPQLLGRLSQHAIGRSMLLFSVTFCLSVVFAVWATAYNFVPGGEATRERTHILILFGVILLGLATCVSGQSITGQGKSEDVSDTNRRKELLRKRHLSSKAMAGMCSWPCFWFHSYCFLWWQVRTRGKAYTKMSFYDVAVLV